MRFIKKYETFKHRQPKHITDDEYVLKMEAYERESFNDKEIKFFQKLKQRNNSIYELDIRGDWSDACCSELRNIKGCSKALIVIIGEEDDLTEIDIIKLADSWYLINEVGIDKFLCDEWDEVLGYLGTQTNLKF